MSIYVFFKIFIHSKTSPMFFMQYKLNTFIMCCLNSGALHQNLKNLIKLYLQIIYNFDLIFHAISW